MRRFQGQARSSLPRKLLGVPTGIPTATHEAPAGSTRHAPKKTSLLFQFPTPPLPPPGCLGGFCSVQLPCRALVCDRQFTATGPASCFISGLRFSPSKRDVFLWLRSSCDKHDSKILSLNCLACRLFELALFRSGGLWVLGLLVLEDHAERQQREGTVIHTSLRKASTYCARKKV